MKTHTETCNLPIPDGYTFKDFRVPIPKSGEPFICSQGLVQHATNKHFDIPRIILEKKYMPEPGDVVEVFGYGSHPDYMDGFYVVRKVEEDKIYVTDEFCSFATSSHVRPAVPTEVIDMTISVSPETLIFELSYKHGYPLYKNPKHYTHTDSVSRNWHGFADEHGVPYTRVGFLYPGENYRSGFDPDWVSIDIEGRSSLANRIVFKRTDALIQEG